MMLLDAIDALLSARCCAARHAALRHIYADIDDYCLPLTLADAASATRFRFHAIDATLTLMMLLPIAMILLMFRLPFRHAILIPPAVSFDVSPDIIIFRCHAACLFYAALFRPCRRRLRAQRFTRLLQRCAALMIARHAHARGGVDVACGARQATWRGDKI